MEATFVVDLSNNQQEFVERFVRFFAGRKIKITVQEVSEEAQPTNQTEVFQQMEAIRNQLKSIQIPLDADFNQLIDLMNDQSL